MEVKMLDVDSTSALKYQNIIWRLVGIHPPEPSSPWAKFFLFYSIPINFLNVFVTPLSFCVKCIGSDSLAAFCESFYLASIMVVQQLKLLNTIRERGQLREVDNILRQLDMRLETEEERGIIRSRIEQSQKLSVWILKVYFFDLVFGFCYALFSAGYILPFSAAYPWDWHQSRRAYLLTLVFQCFLIAVYAPMAANVDTFPLVYLNLLAGHCKALGRRIVKLGHSGLSAEQNQQQLIACIQTHQIILGLKDTLQSSLSVAFFIQFGCTAISLCAISFFAAVIKLDLLKALHLVGMLLGILLGTLIICYASELVNEAAAMIPDAIYANNWMDQSPRFCQSLRFMLMRSQSPMGMVALKVIPVGMPTFLVVIKMAYSLFTLLNDFNG